MGKGVKFLIVCTVRSTWHTLPSVTVSTRVLHHHTDATVVAAAWLGLAWLAIISIFHHSINDPTLFSFTFPEPKNNYGKKKVRCCESVLSQNLSGWSYIIASCHGVNMMLT